MSTVAVAVFFFTGIGVKGFLGGPCLSVGSSRIIFPCFEHSLHTVSLALSIMALMGLPWILHPQTSHRNRFSPRFLYYMVVFIVVESKNVEQR